MEILKRNIYLIILVLISLIVVVPLFHSGFFNIHDDAQIQRVFEMRQSLLDGMFPVRWVSDLGYGYGYPIFNFYGPFPYYLGAIITFFGLNSLIATKIIIFVALIGSGLSMYFLAKDFWGEKGALISSIFYVFAPYHALNSYVRGDVGELYSYLFIPLVFLGIWKFYKTNKFKFVVLGSLSFSLIIISHNLSALMISPFILLVTFLALIKKRKWSIILIPILGILVSSFYFIPALLEMNFTNVLSTIGGKAHFSDHYVCLQQLWSSPWMYGGSIPGCVDGLSFRIGKLHIVFTFISLLSGFMLWKKEKEKSLVLFFSVGSFIFLIFLMLRQSNLIWEMVPYMNFFQYPWRFLLLVSFFSSFATGSLIFIITKNRFNQRVLSLATLILMISLPVFLYSKLFVPQSYNSKTNEDYTNKKYLNWDTSRISDEYLPKNFKKPENQNQIITEKISGENITISDLVTKTNLISAKIDSVGESKIIIHIPYYPAWKYYIDRKEAEINIEKTGISLIVPDGQSKIEGKFRQTNVQILGNSLTLIGILTIVAVIIYYRKKRE